MKAGQKAKIGENNPFRVLVGNLTGRDNKAFKASVVVDEPSGERYGIIGMTYPNVQARKMQNERGSTSLDFERSKAVIAAEVAKLRQQDVNKIILISHMSFANDVEVAKSVPGIDIIVSGDTHVSTPDGVWEYNIETGDPVLIMQTLGEANFYGVTDAVFSNAGKLMRRDTAAQIRMTDPDINSRTIKSVYEDLIPKGEKPFGFSLPYPHHNAVSKVRPNWFNQMFADGLRNVPRLVQAETGTPITDRKGNIIGQVDFALFRSSHFRASIPAKQPIYPFMLKELFPLQNSIVIVEATGQEILQTLKSSLNRWVDRDPRTYFPSGFGYTLDVDRNRLETPFGSNEDGGLDPDMTYTVATTSCVVNDQTTGLYRSEGDPRVLWDSEWDPQENRQPRDLEWLARAVMEDNVANKWYRTYANGFENKLTTSFPRRRESQKPSL